MKHALIKLCHGAQRSSGQLRLGVNTVESCSIAMAPQQDPTSGKQTFDVESQQAQQPSQRVSVNSSVDDLAKQSQASFKPDESEAAARRDQSGHKRRKTIGEHPMWQPGPLDHVKAYFLSPYFHAMIQLAASKLFGGCDRGVNYQFDPRQVRTRVEAE